MLMAASSRLKLAPFKLFGLSSPFHNLSPLVREKYALFNKDFKIDTVDQLAKKYYIKFHTKLQHHPNPLISHLYLFTLPDNTPRRLKRRWCRYHLNYY